MLCSACYTVPASCACCAVLTGLTPCIEAYLNRKRRPAVHRLVLAGSAVQAVLGSQSLLESIVWH